MVAEFYGGILSTKRLSIAVYDNVIFGTLQQFHAIARP